MVCNIVVYHCHSFLFAVAISSILTEGGNNYILLNSLFRSVGVTGSL